MPWVLMSKCATLTETRKVWIDVLAPARVFWEKFGNNVDEGFGVVILLDGAGYLEDVVCDKDGELLTNRGYGIRARIYPGYIVMTRLYTGAVGWLGSVTVRS